MTDPRAALSTLVGALERHLEASASRRGENDPSVIAAYQDLADAFDAYDDALLDTYGEVTPLEVYSEDDEDDDEDDDLEEDDEEEGGVYLGLDDSEYDEDTRSS